MAKFYNIEKDGIANVIDEYQYDAIYKPMGWKIVGNAGGDSEDTPTSATDEAEIRNKTRMRRKADKTFDDNLIKGE